MRIEENAKICFPFENSVNLPEMKKKKAKKTTSRHARAFVFVYRQRQTHKNRSKRIEKISFVSVDYK